MLLAPLAPATRTAVRNHVTWVFDSHIDIRCGDRALRNVLRDAGARRRWFRFGTWRWTYTNDDELASMFAKLRDAGFGFAGAQAGLPPAAIFTSLRERGLLSGEFVELLWSGPGRPLVAQR